MPPSPPRLTLVVLNSKKGCLVHSREIFSWWSWSSATFHCLKELIPEMQQCSWHPQVQPGAGHCLQRGFKAARRSSLEGRGQQQEHTSGEGPSVPLSTSTQPLTQTCSQFSCQAPPPLQTSDQECLGSLLVAGQSLGWFGSRGTGGGWGETR